MIYQQVNCHFDYSCSSWYAGIYQALKNKLQMVRFIKSMNPENKYEINGAI
jgi:hypothetical protein